MDTLTSQVLTGMARHVLTAGGGALVAKGVLDPTSADMAVGAIVTLAGVLWSMWSKFRASKAA